MDGNDKGDDIKIHPKPGQLPVNQETLDILVANIIPTSKYFEVRFDNLEHRFGQHQHNFENFRSDVDKRFNHVDKRFDALKGDFDKRFDDLKSDVDRRFDSFKSDVAERFEQVDKRFEQVDNRFEQVDKRFEQMILSIDRLTDKLDQRDEHQRGFTLRMFTISISISVLGATGVFLKVLGII